ncbi:hypothetical protein SDC9_137721 [bioreactor metagenome]|uniref:Uncharacterized protein n=1 Tax=bioreactor metagenome TaxID=1076179 RepID=A0A645DMC5_9ZZZZ
MNDMRIILYLPVKIEFYFVCVSAQVVPGQINQHHVFGIFFRVAFEAFGSFRVLLKVPCSLSRSGNRVYADGFTLDLTMCFG